MVIGSVNFEYPHFLEEETLFGCIVIFSNSGQACRVEDPILIPRSIDSGTIVFDSPHFSELGGFVIQRGIAMGSADLEDCRFRKPALLGGRNMT